MILSLKTFSTLVRDQVTAAQGRASVALDLTIGSVLRAIFESNASMALWIQWLILQVLQTTRASTSTGDDLDSWVADFSLTRLPAAAATGSLTFSRFTAIGAAVVPVGMTARTADGSRTFVVTTDTNNSAYSSVVNGYVMPDGVASVTVPAVDQTPGAAGNVLAGTITLLGSAASGVDLVSNPSTFLGGEDAESDAALRARFVVYINTLSRGTLGAIEYAIEAVSPTLRYRIDENVDTSGNLMRGNFVVTLDDGSGTIAGSTVTAVADSIDAYRALAVTFNVRKALATAVNVVLAIDVASGITESDVVPLIAQAIRDYISTLPVAGTLHWSRIAQLAYDASPTVTNVYNVTLNTGTADVTADTAHVLVPGTITVA